MLTLLQSSPEKSLVCSFRTVPLSIKARSCELVTTMAFHTLIHLALPVLPLYWQPVQLLISKELLEIYISVADSRVSYQYL